ncbi:unnamed protein product [Protopolystoma xenopodis]|uniref:Uncharacterized protein n=1 Tax=Protopolystoma xenopodis TaxID=117903 RepID=A0A448WRG3_9PLAT|nr:unnamed protein product [Protopolystoma xenopodis]
MLIKSYERVSSFYALPLHLLQFVLTGLAPFPFLESLSRLLFKATLDPSKDLSLPTVIQAKYFPTPSSGSRFKFDLLGWLSGRITANTWCQKAIILAFCFLGLQFSYLIWGILQVCVMQ